jgi:hypothetical protein
MPWFGPFIERQMEGATKSDFLTGTWDYSLHTASQTPAQDTDDFFNDWSATEVTGTNYTALGVVLASKTSVYDTATDEWRFDAADAAWTTATISGIRYGLLWENTAGASSTDPVAAYHDLGAQSVTAANFTVQFDATGIAKIDVT